MLSGGLRGSFRTPSGIGSWDVYPRLDDGSRMSREAHVRFCEGPWVKLPRSTHPYIKVKGVWKDLYRAVDKEGNTIDFLLTAKRDKAAAMRFFEKAMRDNGAPEKVTMDKSGANKAALDQIIEDKEVAVLVRQVKYLNNIVEQDHRAVKRITKPMLGFQSFRSAKNVLAGIELMHMIRKGQLNIPGGDEMSFAEQFYALAGQIRPA